MENAQYTSIILTKSGSCHIFTKSPAPDFTEDHPVAAALIHADRWAGMTTLMAAVRNEANVRRNYVYTVQTLQEIIY